MKQSERKPAWRTVMTLSACLVLVALSGAWALAPATAQPEAGVSSPHSIDYDLSWWTVDGGGYTFSTGDGYSLGGTAGQPDAGALAGNGYVVAGGFWRGAVVQSRYVIYLPLCPR
jgi:hypothetical protein